MSAESVVAADCTLTLVHCFMVESGQSLAGPLKLIKNQNKRVQFNLLQ